MSPLEFSNNARPNSISQRWALAAHSAVLAKLSFAECRQLWDATFQDWDLAQGPRPVWSPTCEVVAHANLTHFMQEQGLNNLPALRQWATHAPVPFWQAVCTRLDIRFEQEPQEWLDLSQGLERAVWGRGAKLNMALSCLPELAEIAGLAKRLHATAPPNPQRPAMVWQAIHGPTDTITAQQLARQVLRVAAGLHQSGWAGKRLALIMPLSPISVAVYLAALYTGSTVVSIADSFSAPEISNRLRLAQAEVVITMDSLARGDKRLPLLPRVQQATELPCLVVGGESNGANTDWDSRWLGSEPSGLRSQDVSWNLWLSEVDDRLIPPAYVAAEDPIHLLFSSGTTGDPKVIPWTPLTPVKCAADGYFHQDIHPDDVVAWPTNLGWMMGPWLIFATLINRASMALYEDAPLGSGFGRFIQDSRTTILGLVPSIVKSWRATSVMEEFDWSRIRLFSSTGESSQREDYLYLSWLAGFKPIIEYCGGTEIGGGYISSTVLEDNAPATFTGPAIGLDVEILDEAGNPANEGELYIVPPSIGLSQSLLNRDHYQTYFADAPILENGRAISRAEIHESENRATCRVLRKHGDHFRRLPGGYYEAGGRTDDTMNLGGIKVSSLELERAINLVPGVRESAAVACSRGGGPDTLVVFLVLADGTALEPESAWLVKLNHAIREQLNPLFKVGQVCLVPQLPRTASNKILRRTLRDQWQQGQ
ncbi:MAG: AMP-binding protein [Planctomycetaceae bacterium]|nr:AMP-binding protein [Planctomycetaceae bacterium]